MESGRTIAGTSGTGAALTLAFAMGFTTGTTASEGAKLGVGDTLLVALVDLVGVCGAGVGVVGIGVVVAVVL